MSQILDIETDKSFELDEFFDFITSNVIPGDSDSLLEHAWSLRALANNREFVLNCYHNELIDIIDGASKNGNQPQSLHIKSNSDFYLRANIWLPIKLGKRTEEFEKRLYSYDLPHDHNFDFLTIGYFGPGYETDIYTYDYALYEGYAGEGVDLEYQGRFQLSPGRMINFRSGKDLHIQYVPEDVSVSLNIICRNSMPNWQQQYIFDVEESKIVGGAGDLLSNRLFIIESAGWLGNDETVGILKDIIRDFPCDKTKAVALNAIGGIAPAEFERAAIDATSSVVELASKTPVTGNFARSHAGG
ncbi:hypothetical protein [Altererythrobacter sp. Root672]|uniref:hypothetical protein n=1 Tax=Altererythrobacter sp. Root672 TaxID=1736584 RepID=UPI000AE990D9|nr:hypothetical protein [Altererythrobacter sp. Root672]